MNYDFYVDQYGGSLIPEADFLRVSKKAKSMIDFYTFGRIDWGVASAAAKMCICDVAELLFSAEQLSQSGVVSSESVGAYKLSYDKSAEVELVKEPEKRAKAIVERYFAHTGLMYRGV